MGILFRKGDALQRLQEVKIVAIDKTGTLTKGTPETTDLTVLEDLDREDVLRLVASVKRLSGHPIAEAIVTKAREEDVDLAEATAF